jgi:methylmalonyl-CoA/ethylmalonyl-CoA epimerase
MEDPMTAEAKENQTAVHFDKIGQVAITVNDLARSRDFYKDTLGMNLLFDASSMAFFQCGEVRFMIGTSRETVSPGGTILYFKVQDIHETHTVLIEQGVIFTHPPHLVARMPDHELWMAFFDDPDGYQLALMCEVPNA